jgi:hypothetical protein
VVWFFLKEGLLRAANYYNGWPHNFRAEVYYRSAVYREAARRLTTSGGRGYTLLRLTRDPVKRFVSIFRHVCRHPFIRKELNEKLGFETELQGLSLRDFDHFLTGQKLVLPTDVNFHLCAQYHPVWDLAFDRIITINMDETDLNAGLNDVEREFGLDLTDFTAIQKFGDLRRVHYSLDAPFAGAGPLETYRFKVSETRSFPKKELERLPLTRELARKHHAIDFGRCETADTRALLSA